MTEAADPASNKTPDRWRWRDGFLWGKHTTRFDRLAAMRAFFAFGAMAKPDQRSSKANEYRHLYNTRRWRKRRQRQIEVEPLCRMCLARGVVNDGSRRMDGSTQPDQKRRFLVADHIKEHKGNLRLFWEGELQTLCPDDHDSVKQSQERRGFSTEVGVDGWPLDPRHPAS